MGGYPWKGRRQYWRNLLFGLPLEVYQASLLQIVCFQESTAIYLHGHSPQRLPNCTANMPYDLLLYTECIAVLCGARRKHMFLGGSTRHKHQPIWPVHHHHHHHHFHHPHNLRLLLILPFHEKRYYVHNFKWRLSKTILQICPKALFSLKQISLWNRHSGAFLVHILSFPLKSKFPLQSMRWWMMTKYMH